MLHNYTIGGHSLPLGHDDIHDYLAQYGQVVRWDTESKTLALYYLPPSWDFAMPSCFAPLLLTVFTEAPCQGHICLHWETELPTGILHHQEVFADLALAVEAFLALRERLASMASSVAS